MSGKNDAFTMGIHRKTRRSAWALRFLLDAWIRWESVSIPIDQQADHLGGQGVKQSMRREKFVEGWGNWWVVRVGWMKVESENLHDTVEDGP